MPITDTLTKGGAAAILAALKANGSCWVGGRLKPAARQLAAAGKVQLYPMSIMDLKTQRDHEEYHVTALGS